MRSVPEWIGKTDDEQPPPRVQVRIFDAHEGRCYITGKKLRPGEYDLDHIIALANGGQNRESNLAPVWRPAHKIKTKADMALKKKIAATRKAHLGIRKPPTLRSRNTFQRYEPRVKQLHEEGDHDT